MFLFHNTLPVLPQAENLYENVTMELVFEPVFLLILNSFLATYLNVNKYNFKGNENVCNI